MSSIGEDADDRLSGLPEDAISHILSLMPTKFAVRTSILSKTWRYSWMGVTNLDFDDIHPFYNNKILSKFVDQVMENCKSSRLGLLRLHFSSKQVKKESVSSWIDKAVKLNVSEIDIQVLSFELPLSLFTCKTLTKLRIDRGDSTSRVWECPCPVNLPCLKTLDIAVRNNPFVNAFELICGCPILESLSFEVYVYREEEEDFIFNIPTLKQLKLIVQRVYPSVNKKVVLNVPNLEYLFVGGMLGSLFVMQDLSSFVEASTSFRMSSDDDVWLEFLKGISGVKSLSIKIELRITSFWYSRLVLEFLESCPELKHLCIEEVLSCFSALMTFFCTCLLACEHLDFVIFVKTKQKLTDKRWIKPKLVPACLLTNLTTIKISSCKGRRPEIKFLEYMLGNAKVLKTVTITCKIYPIEEENWFCAKLPKLPRVSRYCEIRFVR